MCSLEVELARKFQFEAQVQAYHIAWALANLADVYGRMGHCEEAFRYGMAGIDNKFPRKSVFILREDLQKSTPSKIPKKDMAS